MRAVLGTMLFCLSISWVQASELSIVGGRATPANLKLDSQSLDLADYSLFGVRFEKDFLFILGFENSLLYGRNMLTPAGSEGNDGLYYNASFVLNLSSASVAPNLAVGIGLMYRFGNTFPKSGLSFSTNFGGGLKLRELLGPVGLRIDYRRVTFYGIQGTHVGTNEFSGGAVLAF